jgi:mRNA interferase MazF
VNKGDIVLVPFPFTDLTDFKLRPAVILLDASNDVVVAFITSQNKWESDFSIQLKATNLNGLKMDSYLRLNKITTLDKNLIVGKLGNLTSHEISLLDQTLFKMLRLKIPE